MSFWKTLGQIGRVAVPIAANFIPGVGPLAAAGIGAAFNGITKGGSLGDKLKSAAGGAVLGGTAGLANNAGIIRSMGKFAAGPLATQAGKALSNPNLPKLLSAGAGAAGLVGQAQQRKQVSQYNEKNTAARDALLQQILSPAGSAIRY